jgi:hypothetical protein
MAKNSPDKKKVVVSNRSTATEPAKARTRVASSVVSDRELTFGRDTYIWLGIGLVFIMTGLALMSGGKMPNADTWDPSLIYSFRRITLAPIFILLGLGIEIYAIFRK